MTVGVASYRLEFAAQAIDALEAQGRGADPAGERGVLALASRMTEQAREELEAVEPKPADAENHRLLTERSRLNRAAIETLEQRYDAPRE